jgi:rhodanese-related sulfurtransferase
MAKKAQPKTRNRTSLLIAGAVILIALLVAAWQMQHAAPSNAHLSAAEPLPREVSVAQAASLRDQGVFMLDVREPSEWEEAHVPGAVLVPLGQLSSRLSEVPTNTPVVIICRSGNRSIQARNLLLNAGYTNVTSVSGGIIDWQQQGFPTVSGM